MDSPNGVMGFLGNFMGGAKQQTPPQQAAMPFIPTNGIPGMPMMPPFAQQQSNVRNNYQSEVSIDDNTPSKLNRPEKLQDTISLNNILETMNKRQKEKEFQNNTVDNLSDEILKSIPSISSRKRGRTQKKRVM